MHNKTFWKLYLPGMRNKNNAVKRKAAIQKQIYTQSKSFYKLVIMLDNHSWLVSRFISVNCYMLLFRFNL